MDKRKNNGGHSTRAKGHDKRRNEYKDILSNALTENELVNVVRKLYEKVEQKGDTNAARIILEHYLGKPKQQIDANITTENPIFNGINLDVTENDSTE